MNSVDLVALPQEEEEKKVAKIILFDGFQKLHWAIFGRNFDAFLSLAAMAFSSSNNSAEEKVAKIILFYEFQKLDPGRRKGERAREYYF